MCLNYMRLHCSRACQPAQPRPQPACVSLLQTAPFGAMSGQPQASASAERPASASGCERAVGLVSPNLGADAGIGKQLQQHGVVDAAIDDMGGAHAGGHGI